jgi:predicted regulator of Ras-like GTPase activity (Roadblock/LC7/MglB family)
MLGGLEIFTSEFSKGKIFSVSCGPKGVIILISDPVINIGIIRLILKRSSKKIEKIFGESFDIDDEDPINFFKFIK